MNKNVIYSNQSVKEIETYEVKSNVTTGFFVDLELRDGYVNAWLYHKDYGVKSLMFGLDPTKCDIYGIINNNLDDQIMFYMEEYMD